MSERIEQPDHDAWTNVYPDGIGHHYWTHARNALVRSLVNGYANGARVLEIGCGRGVVCASLLEHGIDCEGIDLEAHRPIDDRAAPRIRTGVDLFDQDPDWLGGFDAAMMLDVLEHIADPAGFLTRVRGVMPELRTIIVTLPARMELWSNFDTFCGHYRRYDEGSLRALARGAELELVRWGYAFRPMYVMGRLLLMSGRNRSTTIDAPSPMMRPVHGALSALLTLERGVLPDDWKGSTIYGVLRVR